MKREKLRTGSKGYTLLEVLFSIMILAGGLAVIMPAFFKSADLLNHLSGRYQASLLSGELEVEAEGYLKENSDFMGLPLSGNREKAGRIFSYKLDLKPIGSKNEVYEMTALVEWDDFRRNKLQTTLYLIKG